MDEEKKKALSAELAKSPGVYLMKDASGRIVYVGKAKNLAKRVRSYLAPRRSDSRFFVQNLDRYVADIETVLTSTEKEALLLENSLIKLHSPRFNIRLRDDKDYLVIRLDRAARWPRLEILRRPKKDGALYFGPYHSAAAARETLKIVGRHFKLRSCKDREMANRVRPCLQHQIGRCLGPCVLPVDPEEYRRQIEYARLFLLGRLDDLVRELGARMEEASAAFEYEKAALLRDQIRAVNETLRPQQVVFPGGRDHDIIGMFRQGDQVEIAVLEVRGGSLRGKIDFYFADQEFPDPEILSSFIVQRYGEAEQIPDELLVSRPLEDAASLSLLLSEIRGRKCCVRHPGRGPGVSRIAMADRNAEQMLASRLKKEDAVEARLLAIQKRLHLPVLPRRLECVDISHLGGGDTVGAISALVDGEIARPLGRTYKIRTPAEGDDYAAMREVLLRRFARARNGEPGWQAPDLLVVDGGRGQLAVARAVLAEIGIDGQPVVALAKERSAAGAAESDRVFLPGRKNPIPLQARVSALYLLARARDEAHRLASTYQRRLRRKRALGSELDQIPGVGPKTRAALLKALGSVARIRAASAEELLAVDGVGPALARKIREALGR